MTDNKMTAEQALEWSGAQALSCEPEIHQALAVFSADCTEANAVCVIQAVASALSAPRVPDRKGIPANYGYTPTADRPWLMYDPEGDGILFFVTEDEAVAAAEKAIDMSLDDFWSEQVDQICVARVMQLATQVDRVDRPESLNDEYTEDGEWWPEDCEFKCNYKLLPVAASPEPAAPQPVCVVCDGKGSVETDNNGPIVVCPVCRYDDPKAPAVAQANDKQLIADLRAEVEALKETRVMVPYLKNRADAVDGHYCIARLHPHGYHEFWNKEQKEWCSAGSVFELGKIDPDAARLREGGE